MNQDLLKQAKRGIIKLIRENLSIIIIYRKALKDDGFGGEIEDPFAEPTTNKIKCRISHERQGPEKLNNSAVGLSTNLSRYILVDNQTIIYENDSFEEFEIGKAYRIGPVDPLIKFGGIIGYQAPLFEAVRTEDES